MNELDNEMLLLSDIAKLAKKYGLDTFNNLAKLIDSPEFLSNLSNILDTVSKTPLKSEGTKKTTKKISSTTIKNKLMNIQKTEYEKSMILLEFLNTVTAKRALTSIEDIKEILTNNGISVIDDLTKTKALDILFDELIKMPVANVRHLIENIKLVPRNNDRSLEGWSNIILNQRK